MFIKTRTETSTSDEPVRVSGLSHLVNLQDSQQSNAHWHQPKKGFRGPQDTVYQTTNLSVMDRMRGNYEQPNKTGLYPSCVMISGKDSCVFSYRPFYLLSRFVALNPFKMAKKIPKTTYYFLRRHATDNDPALPVVSVQLKAAFSHNYP